MSELYLATNETCSDRWYNILRKYSFATEGVALFTVACVGVLANLLSIATLGQRTMKSKISALLITLAVFDIVFLLCTFPVFTVQSVNAFVAYLNECHYNGDQSKSAMHSAQLFFVIFTKTLMFVSFHFGNFVFSYFRHYGCVIFFTMFSVCKARQARPIIKK